MELLEDAIVRASNAIVEGTYSLSLMEQKLLALLIVNIKDPVDPKGRVVIDLEEFTQVLKHDKSEASVYYLKKLIFGMRDKWITFKNELGDIVHTAWVYSVVCPLHATTATVGISPELIPHLVNLKTRFVEWKLKFVIDMRNKYTYRLYLLLKKNRYKKTCRYTIAELQLKMDAPKSYTNHFGGFKQDILSPSINTINAFTDIDVVTSYKKTGRKVSSIAFTITENIRASPPDKLTLQKLTAAGVTEILATKLINAYSEKVLLGVIGSAKEQISKGLAIKNMDGYFVSGARDRYKPKGGAKKSPQVTGEQGVSPEFTDSNAKPSSKRI